MNILSVYSVLARGCLVGTSPMYLRIAENAVQASTASSSCVISFCNSGFLRGSRECFHSSSCLERFANVSIWPLGSVTVSLVLQ